MRILDEESDDIYLELFKGAYIKQHPEVVRIVKQIIKSYGLVKYPNKVVMDDDGPTYMFPYDNILLNINYSLELLDEFKKTQKIDTVALLPTLKPNDPRNNNARYLGVVNFSFEFDINKNKHPIPTGKDIISEFQKSGVLKKGIYNIDIYIYSSNIDDYVDENKHTSALFEVDEKGRYTIIATPKWEDLDDSYFYGDYARKIHD